MKLARGGTNEFNDSDSFEGYDAGVTAKNVGKMFSVTSKNMYRRPIQSIVREITSNCFDSHIEAKVDDPVIIKINYDEGGDYILFKDVGVGISQERMKNVYANWFESTKEDTDDQIGMWGLGSKSPLAYTNSFYLTTCYNGKKWEYCVREGVDKPRIDILTEDDTTERNGSEVKIYIKTINDVNTFFSACKGELLYFDNVYLDTYIRGFNNEYSILEYNTFKYRPDAQYSQQLHLIIGKVPYPINWDDLERKPINIPCGLQFKIGDLQVTPERESIRYIDIELQDGTFISTKDIINKRIEEFIVELTELYHSQAAAEFEDYEEFKRYQEQKSTIVKLDTYSIDITSLIEKKKGVFMPLKDFKGTIPSNLFFRYRSKFLYERGRKARSLDQVVDYSKLIDYLCITMPLSKELTPKKIQYLYDYAYELTGKAVFYVIESDYYGINNLRKLYNLGYEHNYEETNLVKQYRLISNFIKSEFKRLSFKYEEIQITPEWIAKQKEAKASTSNKKENSFLVYNYGGLTITDNKQYIVREELETFTGFIIYGFDEDEELLRNFRILLSYSKYGTSRFTFQKAPKDRYIEPKVCRLYKIAKRNEKFLLDIPNAFYIYDFMGEHKVFKRFATAALIEEEGKALKLTGYPEGKTSMHFQELMEFIFPPVADTMKELDSVCNDYGKLAYGSSDLNVTRKFINDLITVAKQYNLYDKEMLEVYQKLERYTKGLDLLNFTVLNQASLEYIVDFLILMNKRVSDVWFNLEDYERQLIKESKEKIDYLDDVLDRNFAGLNNSIYSGTITGVGYRSFKCLRDLNKSQADKIVSTAKSNYRGLNCLIKYHEKRKAVTN